jgi:twitching motility two-component system response regulator PilH
LLDRLKQLFAEAKAPVAQEIVAPVVETAAEAEARADRRKKKRINAVAGTKVLIVDDSPTIVALLSRMLKQNQYTVLEAGDGESALEIARAQRPGLIFLDIVLPGMSGFTALRTLRHDPVTKDIPIVMISGNAQATEQFYVQRIGADNFMKKPFSRAEVFTYIERLLDENFVPRRFNTFVHDTTLEPEVEEAEEIASTPGESDATMAEQAPIAETNVEAAAEVPAPEVTDVAAPTMATPEVVTPEVATLEIASPAVATPVVATTAVETVAVTQAPAETSAAAPVVEATAPAAKVEAASPTPSVDTSASAPAPVPAQTTLSFAEMVEALIEASDSSDGAQAEASTPASNESAAAPKQAEPAAPDVFADINAGWRRPVHRTPPPG